MMGRWRDHGRRKTIGITFDLENIYLDQEDPLIYSLRYGRDGILKTLDNIHQFLTVVVRKLVAIQKFVDDIRYERMIILLLFRFHPRYYNYFRFIDFIPPFSHILVRSTSKFGIRPLTSLNEVMLFVYFPLKFAPLNASFIVSKSTMFTTG